MQCEPELAALLRRTEAPPFLYTGAAQRHSESGLRLATEILHELLKG